MAFMFFNNELIDESSAYIPINDRGFMYGESVFTTIRCYNGQPFLLNKHCDRINATINSGILGNLDAINYEKIKSQITTLIENNQYKDGICKIRITGGTSDGPIRPKQQHPNILITLQPYTPPQRLQQNGIILDIANHRRNKKSKTTSHKLGNFLENIIVRNEINTKAYEAIIISLTGEILECACSNIFAVKNEVIFTPPLSENILPGITRSKIINISKEQNMQVREQSFNLEFLLTADEIFITNCAIEILPVLQILGYKSDFSSTSFSTANRLLKSYQSNIGVNQK